MANLSELTARYERACEVLQQYFLDHDSLKPWEPVKSESTINSRCVYLRNGKKLAKIDSGILAHAPVYVNGAKSTENVFGVLVEYYSPGEPSLIDVAKRTGDVGKQVIP
jgi:hypothetical protein